MSLKDKLKKNQKLRNVYLLSKNIKHFLCFKPFLLIKKYSWFFKELKIFKKKPNNNEFNRIEYYPCFFDNTDYTPVEPIYFYQDCWAAKHIFEMKPSHYYDVGNSFKKMGIISKFFSVTWVDIRLKELKLPNLFFKKDSILDLLFEDNSIEFLSSLWYTYQLTSGYNEKIWFLEQDFIT